MNDAPHNGERITVLAEQLNLHLRKAWTVESRHRGSRRAGFPVGVPPRRAQAIPPSPNLCFWLFFFRFILSDRPTSIVHHRVGSSRAFLFAGDGA